MKDWIELLPPTAFVDPKDRYENIWGKRVPKVYDDGDFFITYMGYTSLYPDTPFWVFDYYKVEERRQEGKREAPYFMRSSWDEAKYDIVELRKNYELGRGPEGPASFLELSTGIFASGKDYAEEPRTQATETPLPACAMCGLSIVAKEGDICEECEKQLEQRKRFFAFKRSEAKKQEAFDAGDRREMQIGDIGEEDYYGTYEKDIPPEKYGFTKEQIEERKKKIEEGEGMTLPLTEKKVSKFTPPISKEREIQIVLEKLKEKFD